MTQPTQYPLSHRAALAASGHYEKPRVPMVVNRAVVAAAGASKDGPSPYEQTPEDVFRPYKTLAGVVPEGMAMDAVPALVNGAALWAVQSLFHEGQGFFGYPYLAELVQRAEYRHAAEIWAEHSVRKWIKFTGGSEQQRNDLWAEFERLAVRDVVQTWIYHDHVFGRGQVFLDFGDADSPTENVTPLTVTSAKISKSRPLQQITNVEPMWTSPGTYATSNPLRADFYKPERWFVYGRSVHRSRLLTITSRPVSDMLKPAYNFGGQSLTQLMKPYVDNWLRTRQAVSDMVNAYSVFVLKTDMSSAMGVNATGADLFARLDLFNQLRDNRGSMAIDLDGEELTNIAVSLAGLSDLQGQAQEQLASVSRIPLSIYLQITPTGLNATSDGETRNFYADVHSYQEKNVRPPLATIFQIAQLSLWGAIVPDLKFQFLPLWEMSDKERAENRKTDAEAHAQYVTMGAVSNEEVREVLAADEDGLYHGVDLSGPPPEPPEDDATNDEPPGGADA